MNIQPLWLGPNHPPCATPPNPPNEPRPRLAPAEVKQLRAFLDGAIMDAGVRHHLWRGWGLCPRHSWAYAAIEIEEGGSRPLSTTILLDDLMGRVVRLWHRSRPMPLAIALFRLRSSASCYTCEFVAMTERVAARGGRASPAAPVGDLARVRSMLTGLEPIWRGRTCPTCAGGDGPVCRPHLLSGEPPASRREMERTLAALHERLDLFLRSMTWKGPTASALDSVSWIEAMGWLYGWQSPISALPGSLPSSSLSSPP